jgi:hypothetical protein
MRRIYPLLVITWLVLIGIAAAQYVCLYDGEQPPQMPGVKHVARVPRTAAEQQVHDDVAAMLRDAGVKRSLRAYPAGTVIDLEKGATGADVAALAASKAERMPAAAKLRAALDTNTYAQAIREQRAIVRVATTNDVTATRRAMAKAILELDKLRALKARAVAEQLRLGITQDEDEEEP